MSVLISGHFHTALVEMPRNQGGVGSNPTG